MAAVVIQSFLFTIYLHRNGEKGPKTLTLQILTLVIGIHFINLILGRLIVDYPGYGASWIFLTLYGPLIYNYVQFYINSVDRLNYLHFVTPIYPLLLWCFTNKLHMESSSDQYFDLWVSLPIYSIFLIYLLLSLYKVYSAKEKDMNMKWLRYLVLSFTILIGQHLLVLLIYSRGQGQLATVLYIIEIIYMLFFISGMVYTAMSRPSIFIDIQKVIDAIPRAPKYFYSSIDEAQIDSMYTKLQEVMNLDKPYLNPELTLEGLSADLGFSKRHLSQVINDRLNKNFNDYINGYRIRDALKMLDDHQRDLRIFEVMYDVGFNSKSSFNLSFKKYTGKTPTLYRLSTLRANNKS